MLLQKLGNRLAFSLIFSDYLSQLFISTYAISSYVFTNAFLSKFVDLCCLCFCRFVNSFVYYGISLNAGSLAGDIFLNNTLSTILRF